MKILPNTQRLGKLTFDSNQVKKSKTNPNVTNVSVNSIILLTPFCYLYSFS